MLRPTHIRRRLMGKIKPKWKIDSRCQQLYRNRNTRTTMTQKIVEAKKLVRKCCFQCVRNLLLKTVRNIKIIRATSGAPVTVRASIARRISFDRIQCVIHFYLIFLSFKHPFKCSAHSRFRLFAVLFKRDDGSGNRWFVWFLGTHETAIYQSITYCVRRIRCVCAVGEMRVWHCDMWKWKIWQFIVNLKWIGVSFWFFLHHKTFEEFSPEFCATRINHANGISTAFFGCIILFVASNSFFNF